MKISGFTFAKNASKFYFPIKESITSILPIVDEFIVALGDCDQDDDTLALINSIGSEKIKIINTVWDSNEYPDNTLYAQQTDFAKSKCSGDWLFYIQCDEVMHEKHLDTVLNACEKYYSKEQVEGFLFKYRHFWGDYNHYFNAHSWYPKEIRIIRNLPEIHSWRDAQSFRLYDTFNNGYQEYLRKEGTSKLRVVEIDAYIHHYGWVRPPKVMTRKAKVGNPLLAQKGIFERNRKNIPDIFDYGPLDKLTTYKYPHPAVMNDWIARFDWKDQLQYSGSRNPDRPIYKHERLKYRIVSFIENRFLGGRRIGGFNNYKLIHP